MQEVTESSTQNPLRKPEGFDPGLQCLAGVFVFTMAVKLILPMLTQTHSHILIELGLLGDFAGLVVLFTVAGLLWLRRKRAVRPPRVWALAMAVLWMSGQSLVYLNFAFRHHENAATERRIAENVNQMQGEQAAGQESAYSGNEFNRESGPAQVDRKTFSLTLPDRWAEKTNDDMYEPDSCVFFEGPESCFFNVTVGKKSTGVTIGAFIESQNKVMRQKFTDITTSKEINQWANFTGKGMEIIGKPGGLTRSQVRFFSFENGDNVCLIMEFGTIADLQRYSNDFETIRQTFKLKSVASSVSDVTFPRKQ